jgi:hypothetical protein
MTFALTPRVTLLVILALSGCASLASLDEFGPAPGAGGDGGAPGGSGGAPGGSGGGGGSGGVGAATVGGGGMGATGAEGGATSHCNDGKLSGDETDEDCGGSCEACTLGDDCQVAGDCRSGVCAGTCACGDGMVFSEFRSRGPNGGLDEIVELFNASDAAITLTTDYTIVARDVNGASFSLRWTGNGQVVPPHTHFLITGSAYTGAVAADAVLVTGITDSSAIVLRDGGSAVDVMCVCDGGACSPLASSGDCEGTPAKNPSQVPIGSDDRSIERKLGQPSGHCVDTGDTESDFVAIPSDPQNLASGATVL